MYLCTQDMRTLNNSEWRKIQLYMHVLNLFSLFSVIHICKLFLFQNKGGHLPLKVKLPLCMPWRRVWVAKVHLHIFLTLALESSKWLTSHFNRFTPPPITHWVAEWVGPISSSPTACCCTEWTLQCTVTVCSDSEGALWDRGAQWLKMTELLFTVDCWWISISGGGFTVTLTAAVCRTVLTCRIYQNMRWSPPPLAIFSLQEGAYV
jgi:hypothetical protein